MVFSVALVFVNTMYQREITLLIIYDHPIAGWPPLLGDTGSSAMAKMPKMPPAQPGPSSQA